MSKYSSLLVTILFFCGCVPQRQITPASDWRNRKEMIDYIIKGNISDNIYDSADIYQRGRFYYASRRDRGDFVYTPAEAKEHLLDGVVLFITATHAYHWEFAKGLPDGRFIYSQRTIPSFSIIETYREGELLKREKFQDGPPPYLVETFQNGRLLKKEGSDSPPKK